MTTDRGPILLGIARGAIAEELGLGAPPDAEAPWLQEPGATFVTLKLHGELRGCIGTLTARSPLREDVAYNARAAAFHDSRFPPLSRGEFPGIDLEVSLLSPLEPIPHAGEAHLLTLLRPGLDGVVLEWGSCRGTFLPQVWEQLPDPKDFLDHLKRKAGLPRNAWNEGIKASRYTVARFHEGAAVGGRR